jgi:hypothetical protein
MKKETERTRERERENEKKTGHVIHKVARAPPAYLLLRVVLLHTQTNTTPKKKKKIKNPKHKHDPPRENTLFIVFTLKSFEEVQTRALFRKGHERSISATSLRLSLSSRISKPK